MDKRDQILELADHSAARALGALSCFLGCDFRAPTRAREWEGRDVDWLRRAPEEEAIALFADLDGAIGGKLGVLLSSTAARQFVSPLVRREPGPGREWMECSALLEAGNVAFSAAAGALGDAIGVVVFPSVPRIWREDDPGFRVDLDDRDLDALGAYAVFAKADIAGKELGICLIWLPTRAE